MLGGGPYVCKTCPKCQENNMWNGKCARCGYVEPEEDEEE